MSEVSFFQRYSQRENHATNNTLLVLRHFYSNRPQKLERILSELLDEEVDLGVQFSQQVRGSDSVPDAHIFQKSFDLFVEAKLGGSLDQDQINRHIKTINNLKSEGAVGSSFLIGLTKDEISNSQKEMLRNEAKGKGITFSATTFSKLVDAIEAVCEDHETNLKEVIDDYRAFLDQEELLEAGDILTVFPTGISMAENNKYSLYFEPAKRSSKSRSRFVGLYKEKTVRFIGEITKVIIGVCAGGNSDFVVQKAEKGKYSEDDISRISNAIKASSYFGNFAQEPHRYYLVDKFVKTDFKKITKYGIWGPRVFRLDSILGQDYKSDATVGSVAEILQQRTF